MIEAVVLAAGKGSRMRSKLPKVLHKVGGYAMVEHVLNRVESVGVTQSHVVIGHGAELVQDALKDRNCKFALQEQQLGTGHAVAQAMPEVSGDATVLILYGDVPFTSSETMASLCKIAADGKLGLLTVMLDDPTGYGRIVRNAETGSVESIVEHKDASDEQRKIREVNTGIMAVPAAALGRWLPALSSENAQGEYYLTDIIAMSVAEGVKVEAIQPGSAFEVQGVNDRVQLAGLETWHQQQREAELMRAGVTMLKPGSLSVRGEVTVGSDIIMDANVVLDGNVIIEDEVMIEANCVLKDCRIGAGSVIKAFSHIESAEVANGCEVGPYARLRPGAELHDKAKVGNFVEIKKAVVCAGAKVNHLTYIGDAEIGQNTNVGAGTITCNYDGVNKSKTMVGANVFIGSNTSLVAPVTLGEGVTIGAGSVITGDVPAGELAVARGRQKNISGWKRPVKKSK